MAVSIFRPDPGGRYSRARYYQPGRQRFVSEDPIGFDSGDVNLYAYVLNSPTRFVDALGLDPSGSHNVQTYGRWEHFGEHGWFRVWATREGLVGHRTASGHIIQADDAFVALPSPSGLGKLVEVEFGTSCMMAPVLDVGPHSIDDPYWEQGGRPKAESGQRTASLQKKYGPPKNKAGIDLSDQAFRELGMKDNGYVWWRLAPLTGRYNSPCGH